MAATYGPLLLQVIPSIFLSCIVFRLILTEVLTVMGADF